MNPARVSQSSRGRGRHGLTPPDDCASPAALLRRHGKWAKQQDIGSSSRPARDPKKAHEREV
jgi:hypothetical protein